MITVLMLAVDGGLLTCREILEQLMRFGDKLSSFKSEFSPDESRDYENDLFFIRGGIEPFEKTQILGRLHSCAQRLEQWVEERAKEHLIREILQPYADRLHIRLKDDSTFEARDLFKDFTEGDKTQYLVNRYLREDPRVEERVYKKGQIIIRYGEKAESCFILLKGSAFVTISNDVAESQKVREIGSTAFIGEIALVHEGGHRTAEVVATSEVEALEIPNSVFQELLKDRSFRLFIQFLSIDRLLEDISRNHGDRSPVEMRSVSRNRIKRDKQANEERSINKW
jgi:CRP-like cAMP-binding protein